MGSGSMGAIMVMSCQVYHFVKDIKRLYKKSAVIAALCAKVESHRYTAMETPTKVFTALDFGTEDLRLILISFLV